MRTPLLTALAASAVLWPATLCAESVTLQITDPRDGYKTHYAASWLQTPAERERYWMCDRPLWVAPGVGQKISRLYQGGAHVDVVATDGEGEGDAGAKRVICKLADPAPSKASPDKADGEAPAH
jgi:hypothetical protein